MRYGTSLCSLSRHNIGMTTAFRPPVSSIGHHACSGTLLDAAFYPEPTVPTKSCFRNKNLLQTIYKLQIQTSLLAKPWGQDNVWIGD